MALPYLYHIARCGVQFRTSASHLDSMHNWKRLSLLGMASISLVTLIFWASYDNDVCHTIYTPNNPGIEVRYPILMSAIVLSTLWELYRKPWPPSLTCNISHTLARSLAAHSAITRCVSNLCPPSWALGLIEPDPGNWLDISIRKSIRDTFLCVALTFHGNN